MEAVEAIYENGVFRPIEKVDLSNGIKVEITIKLPEEKDSAETIPDLATNIDYYLYGLPKQDGIMKVL